MDTTEKMLEHRGEAEALHCTTATKREFVRREGKQLHTDHAASPQANTAPCKELSPQPLVSPVGKENMG